jgi:hypothetical protein
MNKSILMAGFGMAFVCFGGVFLITNTSPKPNAGETVYGSDGTSAHVSLVRLEDGTRCAVVVGMYKGGISCDWK